MHPFMLKFCKFFIVRFRFRVEAHVRRIVLGVVVLWGVARVPEMPSLTARAPAALNFSTRVVAVAQLLDLHSDLGQRPAEVPARHFPVAAVRVHGRSVEIMDGGNVRVSADEKFPRPRLGELVKRLVIGTVPFPGDLAVDVEEISCESHFVGIRQEKPVLEPRRRGRQCRQLSIPNNDCLLHRTEATRTSEHLLLAHRHVPTGRSIAVKSRQVSFYVEPRLVPDVITTIDEEVLPRFSQMPHFLGFVALQSELGGARPEIVALSFSDDGLEDSETASEEFRDEIQRVTGTTSSRKAFDILRVMVHDTNGAPCHDSPAGPLHHKSPRNCFPTPLIATLS